MDQAGLIGMGHSHHIVYFSKPSAFFLKKNCLSVRQFQLFYF